MKKSTVNIKRFFIENRYSVLFSIAVILILVFSFVDIVLSNDSYFLFYGDNVEQVVPFYSHIIDSLRDWPIKLWDISSGFGANFFIYFISFLGSPFVVVSAIFNLINVEDFILLFDLVRFILISLFSYFWLSKLTNSPTARIAGSLVITFSGWIMYWIHFGPFIDAYMFLPLMLYLLEEVLENRKKPFFIISIILSALSSFYIFYISTWILFIYLTYRYFIKSKTYSPKTYFYEFLLVVKYYIIAIGLIAFIVLPSVYIVLTSPRLSNEAIQLWIPNFELSNIYNFVSSFFSPVLSDYSTNQFLSREVYKNIGLKYQYSFLLFPMLFPVLFSIKNKNKKWILSLLVLFYFLSFIPFFNLLFNANQDVRWHMMLTFINVLMIVFVLENKSQIKWYLWILSGIVSLASIMFFYKFGMSNWYILPTNLPMVYKNVLISIFIIVCYIIYFLSHENRYAIVFFVMILVFEGWFSIHSRIYIDDSPRYILADVVDVIIPDEKDFYSDFIAQDDGAYRIDVPYVNGNHAILNSYPGFISYNSLYNHEIRDLMDERLSPSWNMGYAPSKFLLKTLMGSKYFIIKDNTIEIPYGYKYLKTEGEYVIFKNQIETGLGYATNKIISRDIADSYDKSIQDVIMYKGIILDKVISESLEISDLPTHLGNNLTNDYIELPKSSGYIFIDYSKTYPYTQCIVDFYKNGNLMEQATRDEYGYTAISYSENYDGAYVYCNSIYNQAQFIPVNVYFLTNEFIQKMYAGLEEFDFFYDVKKTNNGYTANINISDKGSYISTTIAYDIGWIVLVDGEKVETVKSNYAFLSFEIPKGEHEIQLKYFPPFLKIGIGISIFTLCLTIFLWIKNSLVSK